MLLDSIYLFPVLIDLCGYEVVLVLHSVYFPSGVLDAFESFLDLCPDLLGIIEIDYPLLGLFLFSATLHRGLVISLNHRHIIFLYHQRISASLLLRDDVPSVL